MSRPECALEGPGHRALQIGLQHHRMPDLLNSAARRHRDALLDQALFHPDPHVAQHQLQQILGFRRGRAPQKGLHRGGPPSRRALYGHRVKGLRHSLQRERGTARSAAIRRHQQIVGRSPQVPMPAVCRGHRRVRRTGNGLQRPGQNRPTRVQPPVVGFRERLAREVQTKAARLLYALRIERRCSQNVLYQPRMPASQPPHSLRDGGPLLQPAALLGQSLGKRRNFTKQSHGYLLLCTEARASRPRHNSGQPAIPIPVRSRTLLEPA